MKRQYNHLWRGLLDAYPNKRIFSGNRNSREYFDGTEGQGVYFLFHKKDGLLYIGQSENIWSRFQINHHVIKNKNSHEFLIGVIPTKDATERLELEAWCIRTFNPPLNSTASLANPKRKEEVIKLRQEGKTLQAIGDKFGITRERVRQIIAGIQ